MRKLIILRGLPGCGKSTWIKNHSLENYTLSTDTIRLMYTAPQLTVSNEYGYTDISQKANSKVWKTLFDMLEYRMRNGSFTVIDATNLTTDSLNKYKKMARTYRYRLAVVDFTDISINTVLERNQKRKTINHGLSCVSEEVIMRMSDSIGDIPSGYITIKHDNDKLFKEFISVEPLDMSNKNKVVFIGDIHGCYSALMRYVDTIKGIKEDDGNYYIFLGDYFDRGVENAETFRFLSSIQEFHNVLFLEGNHEKHLLSYIHDEKMNETLTFQSKTLPEFKKAGITKKDVKRFCSHLAQMAYISYNGENILATHAGISSTDSMSLSFVDTKEFTHGTGNYQDVQKVADNWNDTTNNDTIQVFGHRNFFHSQSAKLNDTCYCLENHVETLLDNSGTLRILELTSQGVKALDFFNPKWNYGYENESNPRLKFVVNSMRSNKKMISEHVLHDNISSFNFTRDAFYNSSWNTLSTKARGFFIDTMKNKVVARSYDKFFNFNEMKSTTLQSLEKNLQFPVVAYRKENGFLGILSTFNDDLMFCSKSQDADTENAEYANLFKKIFMETIFLKDEDKIQKREALIRFMKEGNISLVFEVIAPNVDAHIIKYTNNHVVLLDAVKNDIDFSVLNYEELKRIAENFDFQVKQSVDKFYSFRELNLFLDYQTNKFSLNERFDNPDMNKDDCFEGFVLKDANDFMFKFKTNYYRFWKMMRSLIEYSSYPNGSGHLPSVPSSLEKSSTEFPDDVKEEMMYLYVPFRRFIEQKIATGEHNQLLAEDVKDKSIIQLREMFFKNENE